ncbi:4,5-DOPA dioxygenase extradiol [Paenimyroides tangerinum]|uniref:4,5-DOPA dioxygenase extradiol n=1 Tax=Paenimyroides tangerinum TaxID=2488728 RepID=A0A3P3W8K8_9FLAO|nr:4,5-DOPA dioxygenase extradiol [Paenimyroides tangerinum]RRJ91492.1 4,5-DOPA dioxygenase extradiol [Paenimyroides tangerinum]
MNNLYNFTKDFKVREKLQPVFFIGHGSPMNGIENNVFSEQWKKIGKQIDLPSAVLVISAHWLTKGTHVTAMKEPKTIHDFGGFPQALFDVQYPAPGSPFLAGETAKLITSTDVGLDHDWGLDHGTWTVVRHMFPDANVPVLQLSIDYNQPASYHYNLAKQLFDLRKRGVLILGSGNMIHNLRMLDWRSIDSPGFGFDWAIELNDIFKKKILSKDHTSLINYEGLSKNAKLAIPTPDHYYPMIYNLALQSEKDNVEFFNDDYVGGSLSMTSFRFGL